MLLVFVGLFAGIPAGFADSAFDPARVQSPACRPPAYLCGFQPPGRDDLAAVPFARDLLRPGERAALPSRVDLRPQMPPVGDQGPHASGVAWALAYGLMSHGQARLAARSAQLDASGRDAMVVRGPGRGSVARKPCAADAVDAGLLSSPAALYRALNGGQDRGVDLLRAGRYLVQRGVPACSAAPYDPDGFAIKGEAATSAPVFRARGLRRLDPRRSGEIEARLARGQSIAVGLSIYENFYDLGRGVYEAPTEPEARARAFRGGHAVVIVGYDRNKRSARGETGAFLFQNSFSRDWGDRGFGWISYRAFRQLVRSAVVLDFGDAEFAAADSLSLPDSAGGAGVHAVSLSEAAPTTVVASRGHFVDRIVVQFDAVPGALAYEIWRAWPQSLSENKSRPFELIGYSRETRFVDRLVQPGVAFRYRVRAVAAGGISPDSAAVAEGFAASGKNAAGETQSVPLQVVGLRAPVRLREGRAAVELRWSAAQGARAYRVMRFESKRNRWRLLSRSQSATSYRDRRPRAGEWNIYRVQAINAAGRAAWSASARAFVGDSSRAPAPVRRAAASRGRFADRIELRWEAVPGADRYRVYRFARLSGGDGRGEWRGPFEVSTTAYVDLLSGGDAGETGSGAYIAYRVAAGNARGYSDPGPVVFGFARATADQPATSAKLRLKSSRGSGVELEWDPVPGAAAYFVLRKRAGETDFGFIGNVAAQGKENAGEALRLRDDFGPADGAGEIFLYTVRAADAAGRESENSNIVAAFAQPERRPARKRFFWSNDVGDVKAPRFAGVWTALDWDGESGPRRIEMRINRNGPRFQGEYRIGNNPSRKFEGEYVYGSEVLETRGFRMELLPNSGGGRPGLAAESIVRVESGDLSPYDVELAFERTGF